MTPRNRELAALLVGAGIAGAALSTVTIEVSQRAAWYGVVFAVLYLAAHMVVRQTVPYADGGLLPLAALMTAIGLATITRLDPQDGGRQALWVVIGVAVFAATLVAFGLSRHLTASLVVAFIAGACIVGVVSLYSSLVQLSTGDAMRGRVMSIFMLAFRGGMPLGNLLAGYVAQRWSITTALGSTIPK